MSTNLPGRTAYAQRERDAYAGFFDGSWAAAMVSVISGTRLQDPGVDLIRNWQAQSETRALPGLFSKMADTLLERSLDDVVPFTTTKIRKLREKLIHYLEQQGCAVRPIFRQKLKRALEQLDNDATRAEIRAREEVVAAQTSCWDALLGMDQFHTMLWTSERNCYASLYFYYECFLKECVRLGRGDDNYTVGRDFQEHIRALFGDELANDCWTNSAVNIARLTRSAIAHNGGRLTKHLRSLNHGHTVSDSDELYVSAASTTQLFHDLKTRAMKIAKASVSLPIA